MKNKWIIAIAVAAGFYAVAQAAPVEWGGHYYELVAVNGTWDEANTAAASLSYNGYLGHLATLSSEAEFNFLKTMPGLGEWNITWIGARQVDTEYVWVNSEGTLDFSGWSQSPWAAGEPGGDYGVAITGAGYGSNIQTQPGTCGEYIVEYQAVPEPASALMIGFGAGLLGLIRRFYGRS